MTLFDDPSKEPLKITLTAPRPFRISAGWEDREEAGERGGNWGWGLVFWKSSSIVASRTLTMQTILIFKTLSPEP